MPAMPVRRSSRRQLPLRAFGEDRAGVESGGRIDGSGQAIRQRHVEHVVGDLSGGIAELPDVVVDGDLNPPRPGSLGARTSTPPPASCSPLSGKSSSKTNADNRRSGKRRGSTITLTDCHAPVLWSIH